MKVKNKEFIKNNKFNIVVILIYSILSFVILLYHESWRDEAQAWLIAKNSNIVELLKQLTYEGHAPLWYLILSPFAKLGLPYVTTKIISWLISVITVEIILKKTPFNKLVKLLFIFSYPMLYLYPAISRTYCLLPLAIILVSIYYNQRHEKPIKYILAILLLANTHIIMYGMVGILLVLFYFEELVINRKKNSIEQKKKVYISLIIIIIGLYIVTMPILMSAMNNTDVEEVMNSEENPENFLIKIKNSIQIVTYYTFFANNIIPGSIRGIGVILFLTLILYLYEIIYYRKNSLIITITVLFQLIIYSYIYGCSEQKATACIFLIMFIYWIQKEKPNPKGKKNVIQLIIVYLLTLNITNGVFNIIDEIKYNYSSAQETAKYIENNIEEGSIMICTDMPYSSAIIPYINKNIFWSPQTEEKFTYVTWNEKAKRHYSLRELQESLNENFDENQKLYLLYSYNFKEEVIENLEKNNYIKKVFASRNAKKEEYAIYEINYAFRNIDGE